MNIEISPLLAAARVMTVTKCLSRNRLGKVCGADLAKSAPRSTVGSYFYYLPETGAVTDFSPQIIH